MTDAGAVVGGRAAARETQPFQHDGSHPGVDLQHPFEIVRIEDRVAADTGALSRTDDGRGSVQNEAPPVPTRTDVDRAPFGQRRLQIVPAGLGTTAEAGDGARLTDATMAQIVACTAATTEHATTSIRHAAAGGRATTRGGAAARSRSATPRRVLAQPRAAPLAFLAGRLPSLGTSLLLFRAFVLDLFALLVAALS